MAVVKILYVVHSVAICFLGLSVCQQLFTCWKSTIEALEKRCEICPKITMTPKRRYCRGSNVFIVNFDVALVSRYC